jgi:putative transcriptional regulator
LFPFLFLDAPGVCTGRAEVNSLQGHFLVASSELRDPNFFHAIVLIVRHNADGALGLVLNRPTKAGIRHVWSEVSDAPCASKERLHVGGPCEGLLMALHTRPLLADLEVLPGLYYSGDPDHLRELVNEVETSVRFFVGYAGWGDGQLETELKEGSWLVAPATVQQVFGLDEHSWAQLTKRINSSEIITALGIKHVPSDPSLN